MQYMYVDLTDKVIAAFYEVYNTLGYGFLEKVYENALMAELLERGVSAEQQPALEVEYKGTCVGQYFADLVVNGSVIVEVKAVKTIAPEHEAQLLNYLKATGIRVGLILNFGPRPQIKRLVF
ncbi:GxxExxY protein [Deferrisoma camini]|uniref:GxxExxY protein n=1 Tax=Deferrisoma camini TaxID=1035120 RepID=UPI0004ADA5EE|nr:GxxExxY protein [Deferrisoma camini]